MNKATLICVAVGAVVAAYFVGHSRGRSSGFEDGAVWDSRSADMCTALRAKATLDVLQKSNYTRVAQALNHDIGPIVGNQQKERLGAGLEGRALTAL